MKIDKKELAKVLDSFERVEDIQDIIIIGLNDGIRRIKFQDPID